MIPRLTNDEIISRFRKQHGDKYDYSKVAYTSQNKPVTIICRTHGGFSQLPMNHWKGHGCFQCSYKHRADSKRKLLSEWVKEASEVHDFKYDYSESGQPKSGKSKAIIKCPAHGKFEQRWINHVYSEQGCPKCATYGRYSEEWFENNLNFKDHPSTLYLLKFEGKEEVFYKIGITRRTTKQRWCKNIPYDYSIIYERLSSLYENFKLEQQLLVEYIYKIRSPPKYKIGGDQECFTCDDTQLANLLRLLKPLNQSQEIGASMQP